MPKHLELNPHYASEEYLHAMGVTPRPPGWSIETGPDGCRILAGVTLDDAQLVPGQTWAADTGKVMLVYAGHGYAGYEWWEQGILRQSQDTFSGFQHRYCLCVDGEHVPEQYRLTEADHAASPA